jgi:hypothetical protein
MMTSNKLIIILLLFLGLFASCGKSKKPLTPQQINHIADSIYRIKLKKIQRQSRDDYDKRLPIELKPKVDSILKNNLGGQSVPAFPDDNTNDTI